MASLKDCPFMRLIGIIVAPTSADGPCTCAKLTISTCSASAKIMYCLAGSSSTNISDSTSQSVVLALAMLPRVPICFCSRYVRVLLPVGLARIILEWQRIAVLAAMSFGIIAKQGLLVRNAVGHHFDVAKLAHAQLHL